ncbi:hypothetical protein [Nocardioides marmotae]|uniref:hypothetical protein n=1 Tax=Nocardioides marmotae TaxID=2663857 RepID=UPI0012B5A880|nr:hypothetical protein [Nocardioides marmotae]MBC9734402.1 hypothetical protein [Nocardioides marmotae]MTB85502.1 hypothetical protein [Nocardioides marmotae]
MSDLPGEPPVDPDLAEPLRASNPNATGPQGAAGGMGVSSERVGHAGPGQTSTDGVRDNSVAEPGDETGTEADADDVPPEQSAGGPEANPDPVRPKAGYPSKDPRSADHPFDAKPDL